MVVSQRREDLERAREVLLLALDGDRLLQRASQDGESTAFAESASSLVRELRAVVRELDEIGVPAEEVSVADQLAAKRSARITGADDSASTSRRGQPRRRGGVHPAS